MFSCHKFPALKSINLLYFSMKMCTDLKTIFLASVSSVEPRNLLNQSVRIENNKLLIKDKQYSLRNKCYIVGFGKAVLGMAVQLEEILGPNLERGIVTVPENIFECFRNQPHLLPAPNSKIRFIEGALNNLPDERAYVGALEIKKLASGLGEKDLLIVLISGGGSALLPLPRKPITLQEKLWLVKQLSKRGANIVELNCVRKKVSELKGGGLAKIAKPAKVVSLILSDIIEDPLDFIASGPTVPNLDKDDDALNIIEKYKMSQEIPTSVKNVLQTKNSTAEEHFSHVDNYVIGNNKIAAAAAKTCAEALGYQTIILSTSVSGNVDEISKIYAELVNLITKNSKEDLKVFLKNARNKLNDLNASEIITSLGGGKSLCLISAGEPTVVVSGNGTGGRNQELALRFSVEVNNFNIKMADISFLSCGTDGIDGPTDAAGALGSSNLVNNALKQDLNPTSFLNNNDSYSFYCKYNGGNDLIKTGHTGTNVMDLHIIIIQL